MSLSAQPLEDLVSSMLKQLDALASEGYGDVPLISLVEEAEYETLIRQFPTPERERRVPAPGPPNRARSKRMAYKTRRMIFRAMINGQSWTCAGSTFVPMCPVWNDNEGSLVIDIDTTWKTPDVEDELEIGTELEVEEEPRVELKRSVYMRPSQLLVTLLWLVLFFIGVYPQFRFTIPHRLFSSPACETFMGCRCLRVRSKPYCGNRHCLR